MSTSFFVFIGVQKHVFVCVDKNTNNHLQENYCKAPRPTAQLPTTCQLTACPPRLLSVLFFFFVPHSHAQPKWICINNLLCCRWDAGNFGACSASCGGGVRVRPVRCVQKHQSDLVTVPESECSSDTAPHSAEKCNLHHCPARYVLQYYMCSLDGLELNNYWTCISSNDHRGFVVLYSAASKWVLSGKPLLFARRWRVSEPGNCSAVCGPGEAKRDVSCVRQEDGQDNEVDQSLCSKWIKPADFVPCVVDVCPVGWESEGEVKWKKTLQ